jgi:hypothetical protein
MRWGRKIIDCYDPTNHRAAVSFNKDIDVVDSRHPLARLPTEVTDHFVNVHVRTQAYIAGIHQPPSFVLGIVQQCVHFCTGDVIKQCK